MLTFGKKISTFATVFIACVAGARKGKGEKKSRARARGGEWGGGGGGGERKRLQLSHCLCRLSRSPTNEKSPLVRF